MRNSIKEILQLSKSIKQDGGLKSLNGTFRFDVRGAGHWRVIVRDGRISISQSGQDADCVISCEKEDFIRIANGEQNLLTALMQGRARVKGDLFLAQRFNSVMRARQALRQKGK